MVTEREAFDANGSLKSGFTMRTKIELMDGEPTFVRDMFASKREQITAYNKRVSDAWRTPDAFNAAPKSASKPKPEEEDPDEEELANAQLQTQTAPMPRMTSASLKPGRRDALLPRSATPVPQSGAGLNNEGNLACLSANSRRKPKKYSPIFAMRSRKRAMRRS